ALCTSAIGLQRWRQADRAMRRGLPLPRHPTPGFLAVGLIVLGLMALVLVVVKAVTG
ncbi:MAG: putative rane protein, partial [Mycobacterium sp.]|nr:putative rane protein [Mycobacterium sp.]